MTIPRSKEIRIPALKLLEKHSSLKLMDFKGLLAAKLGITSEEAVENYPSGNGLVFYDRISWALSYMYMAGLVEKPARGIYRISDVGRKQLETPENINSFIDSQLRKREPAERVVGEEEDILPNDLTPQEELSASFAKIRKSVCGEIIDTILGKTPREFEQLVVLLLQRMGYGGEVRESGKVTSYTNDKGIDGIIKEDVLGLGRVHIQAKRYARENLVSRDEIQKFVGALAGTQSSKGVFITTSSFAKSASGYADAFSGPPTIVLIDGMQLAEYIYDFGVGMHIEQTIQLKKLDGDFWDSMDNVPDDVNTP